MRLSLADKQIAEGYKRNVEEIIDVFGKLYSFHVESELTTNLDNYFDMYHFYPKVGDKLIENLQGHQTTDEMVIVAKDNLQQYFASLGL